MARESLFGSLVLYHSMVQDDAFSDQEASTLLMAWAVDCLMITKQYALEVAAATKQIYLQRVPLLEVRL